MGQHDFAIAIDVDHPEVHAALTAATTYLKNGNQLENLSRQENRLRRTLQTSIKLYQQMQDRRREQKNSKPTRPHHKILIRVYLAMHFTHVPLISLWFSQ